MRIYYEPAALITILLILLTVNTTFCLESDETAFQKVDALLLQGDNVQAWEILQNLPENDPNPEESLWRKARTQYEMGRLSESAKNARNYFLSAEKYSREAIAAAPEKADGYKWLAISLGAQAKYSDTKNQIRQSREVKENIERAISIAPEDDLAYLVLSRWHYKVSGLGFFARAYADIVYGGLPDASLKEAENLLWKAIKLRDRIAHRYNLAKIYKRMGRAKAAKTQLQMVLPLPVTFPEEAEEREKTLRKLQE